MVETARLEALALTPGLLERLGAQWQLQLQETSWHGQLPVLLLNRCWLRLERVGVEELAGRLPPDSTAEAPELVRYRALRGEGIEVGLAEVLCWQEFGQEACQLAQRRFWQARERGNQGWTLAAYLAFLAQYRASFERPGPKPLPLLVLARAQSAEPHLLHWMWGPRAVDGANLPPD